MIVERLLNHHGTLVMDRACSKDVGNERRFRLIEECMTESKATEEGDYDCDFSIGPSQGGGACKML